MKKFFLCLAAVSFFSAGLYFALDAYAQEGSAAQPEALIVSPHLVISQFQTGGDGTGGVNDEFVEIHNTSSNPVDLNGYRVVYRSAGGSSDVGNPFASWAVSTVIPPGGFYLIATTVYNGAATPDRTYNTSSCSCSMGGAGGGLAIRFGPNDSGAIIDSVGWGTATNMFIEGGVTAAPAVNNSQSRKSGACQDTDNNAGDFEGTVPAAPRNSASAASPCGGGGTTLFAAINANPTTITVPGNTLITVSVIAATTPPSTGITVVGDLTDIGGSGVQTFFDDGTNGDVTAGDNIFSFLASIPVETTTGTHVVTAVAADAQGRSIPLSQNLTINGSTPTDDPLLLGNPSNATTDTANESNYLMQKPQYSISYNRANNLANWVAWRLDSTWIGSASRQDDYRVDTTLPAGWYRVTPADYAEPVYDRGHMCPSGDRTRSVPDNSATFLMTNMVPQLPANNQGPWADLENYCRTLVASGNELYIISGGFGSAGTIGATQQNRVVVPSVTWKVVMVLPNGSNDLSRVSRATRTFGVIMSNESISQSAPWRNFRTTVDAVEYLTGYNFFSAVPKNTQEIIERRRDKQ